MIQQSKKYLRVHHHQIVLVTLFLLSFAHLNRLGPLEEVELEKDFVVPLLD